MTKEETRELVASLSEEQRTELLFDWSRVARPNQLPPTGNDWAVWLLMAGRGFGKTRSGAEWVRAQKEHTGRIALVAPTAADARDVMVEGESGLMAISPPWDRPLYEPSKRRVTWPNGAMATLYSADEPERLRGPQHFCGWADELAVWRYPDAWDQLMFGLRLGAHPQVVVTTTPRPVKIIRDLLARQGDDVVVVRGSTYENRANLPATFFSQIVSKYEGTRLGRQELNAELLEDVPGALWTRALIEAARLRILDRDLQRVVIAIDPAVTSGDEADETGIVVAAEDSDGHGYVLADASGRYSPREWADLAIRLYRTHGADRIVAEVNNGGEMVEATVRMVDPNVPFTAVRATRGKVVRAEPVAALYEQCVAKGTLIACERGEVPIEHVIPGDMVWTRVGLRRVVWSGQTGVKPTMQIEAGDRMLRLTGNHPVLTGDGWIYAGHLAHKKRIVFIWMGNAKIAARRLVVARDGINVGRVRQLSDGRRGHAVGLLLNLTASNIIDKLMDIGVLPGTLAMNFCTVPSGVSTMVDQFQKITTSITSTVIQGIMTRATSSFSGAVNTLKSTIQTALILLLKPRFAQSVGRSLLLYGPNNSFVSKQNVSVVATHGGPETLEPVFNLHVDDQPEYFANGILVHNCRVHHLGVFPQLEDQLCGFTSDFDKKIAGYSPDRCDALVWAFTDLLVEAEPFAGLMSWYAKKAAEVEEARAE